MSKNEDIAKKGLIPDAAAYQGLVKELHPIDFGSLSKPYVHLESSIGPKVKQVIVAEVLLDKNFNYLNSETVNKQKTR